MLYAWLCCSMYGLAVRCLRRPITTRFKWGIIYIATKRQALKTADRAIKRDAARLTARSPQLSSSRSAIYIPRTAYILYSFVHNRVYQGVKTTTQDNKFWFFLLKKSIFSPLNYMIYLSATETKQISQAIY